MYREAYGNVDTSTVSYRHTDEKHRAAFWEAPPFLYRAQRKLTNIATRLSA